MTPAPEIGSADFDGSSFEEVCPVCGDGCSAEGWAVRYGTWFPGGRPATYLTEAWGYRPLAERDARWRSADGWDFVGVVGVCPHGYIISADSDTGSPAEDS